MHIRRVVMVGNTIIAILATVLCAATLDRIPISKVTHVSKKMSWDDAHDHCKTHHSDVFTVKDEDEAKDLALLGGWLHLSPSYTDLLFKSKNDRCFVLSDSDGVIRISAVDCGSLHPVLCVDERLILVEQKKTWEEALHHCRELLVAGNTKKSYGLASLPERSDFQLDKKIGAEGVWVGLRFLAGKWFWVSSKNFTSSNLPVCPAHLQNCGAFSSTDMHWRTIDCNERRFFLCDIV